MHNLFALAIMVFIAFSASAFEYTISGDLNSTKYDGKKAYLTFYDNNMIIDSAVINDGKFTMKSSWLKSGNARIDVNYEYANLILSPEEVVLDFENHVPLSGDSLNMVLRDYWIKTNNLGGIARALNRGLLSIDSLDMNGISKWKKPPPLIKARCLKILNGGVSTAKYQNYLTMWEKESMSL